MSRRALPLAVVAAAAGAVSAPASAADWTPFPVTGTSGREVPLGFPTSLEFFAPNRGFLMSGANNAKADGIQRFDGGAWTTHATVCGAGAELAIAGPREYWTLTNSSLPRTTVGLCRFLDGEVVGSFSTASSVDRWFTMYGAACRAPNDCWFGGVAGRDESTGRSGAFHLRWDGVGLRTVYNPQGRGVSDIVVHQGQYYESSYAGPGPSGPPAELATPEPVQRLVHRIDGESFVPEALAVPEGLELLAMSSGEDLLWAVGGGAVGGRTRPVTDRLPYAAVLEGGVWRALPEPVAATLAGEAFVDIAPIPGTRRAWAAVRVVNSPQTSSTTTTPDARLVLLDADTGAVRRVSVLGTDGQPRGDAIKVSCPRAGECWMVSDQGYLFRLQEPGVGPLALDDDPLLIGPITFRPNEAFEQPVPDAPPEDDSLLFAPPPIEVQPPEPPPLTQRQCREPVPPLVRNVKRRLLRRGTRLEVRFRTARRARVGLVGRRGRRVVARLKAKTLRPGNQRLTLRLSSRRARYPQRIAFTIAGDTATGRLVDCGASDDTITPGDETVTAGGETAAP